MRIWDTATWRLQTTLLHSNKSWEASFSPDGRWIALSMEASSVRIWDVATGQPVTTSLPHPESVCGVAWSPAGRRLAVLGTHGAVRIWDLARQAQLTKTLNHDSPLHAVCFSPDDRQLATGCADATAHVWNVATAQKVGASMENKQKQTVLRVSWDRTGNRLLTITGSKFLSASDSGVNSVNRSSAMVHLDNGMQI